MPIYEYYCFDCRKRVAVFFRSMSTASDDAARCPHCEGAQLRRMVSRVAVLKSEDSRMEEMADPSMMSGLESEDPRAGQLYAQDEHRDGRTIRRRNE